MHCAQAPEVLWDRGFEHIDEIHQNLARKSLGWRTPLEVFTGDTPCMYDLLDFGYYYWVWYWDPTNARFPTDPRNLGRWLGRDHPHGPQRATKFLNPIGIGLSGHHTLPCQMLTKMTPW
jgi:hypothetical protein